MFRSDTAVTRGNTPAHASHDTPDDAPETPAAGPRTAARWTPQGPCTPAGPIALVDARDLADWLVSAAERGLSGAVNATGPAGMTTFGGLLNLCRKVTGSNAEWVRVPEADLLTAGVKPWVHLPLWLPAATARTAWQVETARIRSLGLTCRPVGASVSDTWAWQRSAGPDPLVPTRRATGLPADLEERLLAAT